MARSRRGRESFSRAWPSCSWFGALGKTCATTGCAELGTSGGHGVSRSAPTWNILREAARVGQALLARSRATIAKFSREACSMKVGVPYEIKDDEYRVALRPVGAEL